jgi:hypothetical protein
MSLSSDVPDDEKEYEVEELLRYRMNEDGDEFYLVKWLGFPVEEATWEPSNHLNDNCSGLIEEFNSNATFTWHDDELSHLNEPGEAATAEKEEDSGAVAAKRPGQPTPSNAKRTKLSEADSAAPEDLATRKLPLQEQPMKRQLRCYCGTNRSNVPTTGKGDFVVCSCCNGALHPNCVQSRLRGKSVPENFACALCRLNKVDEFYPPVGPGTLTHTIASGSQVVSLNFNTQAALWKKNGWALHLRAVSMHDGICGGPAWPHQAVGKLNGRQCVTIEPPEHLHHRRERCYNLTGLLVRARTHSSFGSSLTLNGDVISPWISIVLG